MFQLTKEEKEKLVTNCDHLEHLKLSPTLPYVFTEQGVAMHFEKSKVSEALEKSRVSEVLGKSEVSEALEETVIHKKNK